MLFANSVVSVATEVGPGSCQAERNLAPWSRNILCVVPSPDHVDEETEKCPDCSGPLAVERVDTQYQEEIERRSYVRRFRIPIC
jgi:hypothetical protein